MGADAMADVVMVLTVLGFFGICVGYVSWCGRIIGPDPDDSAAVADAAVDEAMAAVR
jgi:hypothetical protein